MQASDQLLKPSEAASAYGVTPATLARWASEGLEGVRLRVASVGKRKRYRRVDIDEFNAEVARRSGLVPAQGVLATRKDRERADADLRAAGLEW